MWLQEPRFDCRILIILCQSTFRAFVAISTFYHIYGLLEPLLLAIFCWQPNLLFLVFNFSGIYSWAKSSEMPPAFTQYWHCCIPCPHAVYLCILQITGALLLQQGMYTLGTPLQQGMYTLGFLCSDKCIYSAAKSSEVPAAYTQYWHCCIPCPHAVYLLYTLDNRGSPPTTRDVYIWLSSTTRDVQIWLSSTTRDVYIWHSSTTRDVYIQLYSTRDVYTWLSSTTRGLYTWLSKVVLELLSITIKCQATAYFQQIFGNIYFENKYNWKEACKIMNKCKSFASLIVSK